MMESTPFREDFKPSTDSKWPRPRTLVLGLLATIPILGLLGWLITGAVVSKSLRQVQAQTDRLDPGWRFVDVIAKRAKIPVQENSAIQVVVVLSKMNGTFPSPSRRKGGLGESIPRKPDILARLDEVPVEESLDIALTSAIRRELRPLTEAVIEARKLADLGSGRTDPKYQKLLWATLLGHVQNSHHVSRLLTADVAILAEEGELDAALDDCRAMLGVGRSIGDEPFMVSQLVRLAHVVRAMSCAERVLNHGEPGDNALTKLQKQLLDEADHPMALIGLRGDRAMLDDVLAKLATGDLSYKKVQGASANDPVSGAEFLASISSAFVRHNQALALERMSEAVEITKHPLWEQPALWDEFDKKATPAESTFNRIASSLSRETIPSVTAFGNGYLRSRAQIYAMVTLIAAERHRILHGAFPLSVEEIDSSLLPRQFVDPFSGKPLRIKPDSEGGLLVYSVGYDRTDDGGAKLELRRWMTKGSDLGYRLRSPENRKRPSRRDTLPEDVFQRKFDQRESESEND